MRLCLQPFDPQKPRFLHSYDARINLADYQDSLYERSWLIEMPSKNGEQRELFLTIRALSVIRASQMSGRATVVWSVIKLDDLTHRGPHKVSAAVLLFT